MTDGILSEDEIETMLNAAKLSMNNPDVLQGVTSGQDSHDNESNSKINNFANAVAVNITKKITDFLRKNVLATKQKITLVKVKDFGEMNRNGMFTLFNFSSETDKCLLFISIELIHQIINSLYGGQINAKERVVDSLGKVSLIISEKISQIFLNACHESVPNSGKVKLSILEADTFLDVNAIFGRNNLVSHLEFNLNIDSVDMEFVLVMPENFLLPKFDGENFNVGEGGVAIHEKKFWKNAMKEELVDSSVTLTASLPEIKLSLNDFMKMKTDDLIPISNPNHAYICMNNIKLFNALIGKGGERLVAKVLNQI